MISLRYLASLWWYPTWPISLNARHGIVAVFKFAVAVSCFTLFSSPPVWYYCGIWLRCGGIVLRPYLFMPSVVSSRYSASLRRYPASPLSLHIQRGIVAVVSSAVAVSCFALISSCPAWYRCGILLRCGGILLCAYLLLVRTGGSRSAGPRRKRERCLRSEIIDSMEKNLQTSYHAPAFIPFPPLWTSQSRQQDQHRISLS